MVTADSSVSKSALSWVFLLVHPRATLPITLGDKEAQADGILTEIQATVNIS